MRPPLAETIAAARGVDPAEVSPHARSPSKPVSLAEIASIPVTESDEAVVFSRR